MTHEKCFHPSSFSFLRCTLINLRGLAVIQKNFNYCYDFSYCLTTSCGQTGFSLEAICNILQCIILKPSEMEEQQGTFLLKKKTLLSEGNVQDNKTIINNRN